MKTSQSQLSFRVKRLINFLKILMRIKKGIAGLVIIIFFAAIAVAAPLLTPYTPLGEDPQTGGPVAPKYSVASWMRLIPPELGGNPKLSENFRPINNPGLPKLIEEGGEWAFITEVDSGISAYTDLDVGYPFLVPIREYVSKNGSLAIKFEREKGTTYGESKAYLLKEFDYPFAGPPIGFSGNVELLANGSTHSYGMFKYLDVPVKVRVFIGTVEGKEWNLWPPPYTHKSSLYGSLDALGGFTVNYPTGKVTLGTPIIFTDVASLTSFNNHETGELTISMPMSGNEENAHWIISRPSRDTGSSYISDAELARLTMGLSVDKDPVPLIFTKMPGRYLYGIELTFIDTDYAEKRVESTVYLDDLNLEFYGSAFGLMGTDHEGKDLFAQLVYGTRISLFLGISVSIMTVLIGLTVGLAAGYLGKLADELLMRFNDLMLCLPTLPLLIVLAAVVGTRIENLLILMTVIGWNGFARVVRSMTLSLKERPFIEAAKSAGAGSGYIILRHILPNVMAIVYISLATSVPGAITAEASLSWLGFFDPTRMSWGRMLYNVSNLGGTAQAAHNPLWVLLPGLGISLLAVSFILLGYALDDVLNPKLRVRK